MDARPSRKEGSGEPSAHRRQRDEGAVWDMKPRAPFLAVALSTATGVAFAGDPHRVFKAVDLHTHGHGAVADTPLDPPVEGFPTSFRVGGTEHMAVETRLGGGSRRQVRGVVVPDSQHPSDGNGRGPD